MTIKEIKSQNEQGSQVVIDALNEALNDAVEGKIVAVCISTIDRDGEASWITGGRYSVASMIGTLEYSKMGVFSEEVSL